MILLNFSKTGGFFCLYRVCVFKLSLLSNSIPTVQFYFKAAGNINILVPRQFNFKINISTVKLCKK